MPKFIAIHPVDPPAPYTSDAVKSLARKCKAGVSLDALLG